MKFEQQTEDERILWVLTEAATSLLNKKNCTEEESEYHRKMYLYLNSWRARLPIPYEHSFDAEMTVIGPIEDV